jgi:murein DD-endopeptidase MepM/ murein hydrolase activator NlpD
LPVSSSRAEQKYGAQIQEINGEVKRLVVEMDKLRGYNLRLRKALGEPVSSGDSALIRSSEKALAAKSQAERSAESLFALETRGVRQGAGSGSQDPEGSSLGPPPQSPGASSAAGTREAGSQQVASQRPAKMTVTVPFSMPVSGYTTRGFDARYNHYGVDFVGRDGSAVLAAADGNVIFSGWTYNDGMMVMIAHDMGYITVYKHNRALLKNTGDLVKRGDMIALMGNTGATSFGPHLHFEVWKDGIAYNPQEYLLTSQ